MRTGSPFCSLSTPAQISMKLRPDLLISDCSTAFLEPTLSDEQEKQTESNAITEGNRMDPPIIIWRELCPTPKQWHSKQEVSVPASCRLASWRFALPQRVLDSCRPDSSWQVRTQVSSSATRQTEMIPKIYPCCALWT